MRGRLTDWLDGLNPGLIGPVFAALMFLIFVLLTIRGASTCVGPMVCG